MDYNPLKWNWDQAQAAGKHIVSFGAGGVAFAVAAHFISPTQGTDLSGNITDVVDGLTQAAKGMAGLIAAGAAAYSTFKAATKASPSEQIKSVAVNLSAPSADQAASAVADPASRAEIIKAVATMPEVKGIVADKDVAAAVPTEKVVGSVAELPPAAKAA